MRRFDSRALYEAMDQRRAARGLTWAQVARATGVSASTITRTRKGGRLEVDGVLAMVAWLDLPVEHFAREASPYRTNANRAARVPRASSQRTK